VRDEQKRLFTEDRETEIPVLGLSDAVVQHAK